MGRSREQVTLPHTDKSKDTAAATPHAPAHVGAHVHHHHILCIKRVHLLSVGGRQGVTVSQSGKEEVRSSCTTSP